MCGFYLFVWLSPQIYYSYYLILFDGLPLQIVLQQPPSLTEILKLLSFSGQNTLSAHGKSILAYAMLIAAILRQKNQ